MYFLPHLSTALKRLILLLSPGKTHVFHGGEREVGGLGVVGKWGKKIRKYFRAALKAGRENTYVFSKNFLLKMIKNVV